MGLGPLDLSAGPFLMLFGFLSLAALAASQLLPHIWRPQGRPGRLDSVDETAMLAGGEARLAEATLARLLSAGAIALEGSKTFRILDRNAGVSPVERSVLNNANGGNWKDVLRQVGNHGRSIDRRLIAKGLVMSDADARTLKWLSFSPLAAVFALGCIKIFVGIGRDKPVGFLCVLLMVLSILAIKRLPSFDRRTRAGQSQLAVETRRAERLHRAPTNDELGLSVALFGTSVLLGSAFSSLHTLRRNETSGDSGSGGSGGEGGCSSGDGGGGCGGCGGCGG